jgi:hypothetical protein
MRKLWLLAFVLFCLSALAEVQLVKIGDHEPFELTEIAQPVINDMKATPGRGQQFGVGLVLMSDGLKYYIQPAMFMAKRKPDEVCTPTGDVLDYQCKEGQRYAAGCHLLFFDSQGKWVGSNTLQIKEKKSQHFCNNMPAMGVFNKDKNEILVTSQYFLIDSGGAKKIADVGAGWFRMTTLIRVKNNHGKIEIEQDASCLGNPNQLDTIAKARKQLQRCAKGQK